MPLYNNQVTLKEKESHNLNLKRIEARMNLTIAFQLYIKEKIWEMRYKFENGVLIQEEKKNVKIHNQHCCLWQKPNGFYLFGRDVTQIPCFRNSFLYGVYSGLGLGLSYFMFTSKVRNAVVVGYSSFFLTTLSYWYNYSKQKFELLKIQHLLEKKIVLEGTIADVDIGEIEKKTNINEDD
ncbi:cytochrome c oxidase assembly factor COX20 lethal (3) 87Df isoform X1 [Lycorma delicatula]|uniref:cytochrome c oxidase assembly factor COX20 lethal (3) 87Df isoform X1 n=1 Tax=Lycorma delicatula TaxID=130591 RepID=UPI003F50E21E